MSLSNPSRSSSGEVKELTATIKKLNKTNITLTWVIIALTIALVVIALVK